MTTQFRKKFADAKSLQLADPTRTQHTLRSVVDSGTKSVKGVTALNNRLEMISSDTAPLVEGDRTVDEIIAVRVQLSGSTANKQWVAHAWEEMKANVDAAIADGALDGFIPHNAVFTVRHRT